MKKSLLIASLVTLVVFGVALVSYVLDGKPQVSDTPLTQNLGDMQIEIAADRDSRERGLSGRAHVPDNYGMLFVFDEPLQAGIWMKEMLVPIDIVWLSDKGEIVKIENSVSPATYPSVFYPSVPVKYVLETRAGYVLDRGWEVGTVLPLPIPE